MKMNYKSILENIICELIENILDDLRNNNIEIRDRENNLMKLSKEVQKIVSELNDKQRDSVDEYLSEMNSLTCKYYNIIYIQGFKDCIKLLEFIKIL